MRIWETDYFLGKAFQKVLRKYERGLQDDCLPYMDADDLTDLAEYYGIHNEFDKSTTAIEHAAKMHPDAIAPRIFMAREMINTGLWEEARAIVKDIYDFEDNRELTYLRAELLLHDGKYRQAAQILKGRYPGNDTDEKRHSYMREVIGLYMDLFCEDIRKDLVGWGKLLRREVILVREDKMILADMYALLGQIDNSLKYITSVVKKSPYYVHGWELLADIYQRGERYEEAIDAAKYALAINEDCTGASKVLLKSYLALGRWSEVERLLKEYPLDANSQYWAAMELMNFQIYDIAARHLLRAAKACPTKYGVEVSAPLAYCYFMMRDWDNCLHHLQIAGDATPQDAREYFCNIFPYANARDYYMLVGKMIGK